MRSLETLISNGDDHSRLLGALHNIDVYSRDITKASICNLDNLRYVNTVIRATLEDLRNKMSGFEVLAFKSIPRVRGGVIMIENGLGICRRSQGTHYPPDKAKILNSWSHDQSLCFHWLHKNWISALVPYWLLTNWNTNCKQIASDTLFFLVLET